MLGGRSKREVYSKKTWRRYDTGRAGFESSTWLQFQVYAAWITTTTKNPRANRESPRNEG